MDHSCCKRTALTPTASVNSEFKLLRARSSIESIRLFLIYRILKFWENGLLLKIIDRYENKETKAICSPHKTDRPRLTPVSLYDLSSAFIVLGLGIVLSILAFFLEICYNMWKSHQHLVVEV